VQALKGQSSRANPHWWSSMGEKAPVVIHVEPTMTKREVAKLKKDKVQMDERHISTWVEGQTTLVYKPEGLLAALIYDVPGHLDIQNAAYDIYRDVAKNVPTRTAALGVRNIQNMKRDGTPDKFLRPDRTDPRYIYAEKYARDGVMGALDPTRNKAEYCRVTEYDVNDIPVALAHAEFLSAVYAVNAPEPYARQFAAIQQVHPHWTIRGTPFSTATVNWCFPTFPHVESGDFKLGLGILTAYYVGICPESWLVFPRYGVAILVKAGSVLLADVGNEVHANTEISVHDGYGSTSGRLTTIHYLRPAMSKAGTPEQEAQKRLAHLENLAKRRAK
jgi:hypothetical protein